MYIYAKTKVSAFCCVSIFVCFLATDYYYGLIGWSELWTNSTLTYIFANNIRMIRSNIKITPNVVHKMHEIFLTLNLFTNNHGNLLPFHRQLTVWNLYSEISYMHWRTVNLLIPLYQSSPKTVKKQKSFKTHKSLT